MSEEKSETSAKSADAPKTEKAAKTAKAESTAKKTGSSAAKSTTAGAKKSTKDAAKKKSPYAVDKKVAEEKKNTSLLHRMDVNREWVPWVFVPLGLIGVLWLIVFYVAGGAIPFMVAMGNWNFAVGLGCIALAFIVATLWK